MIVTTLKTKPTRRDPAKFIAALPEARREEAARLCALMERITGAPPVVWGRDMVGFGSYDYTTAAGWSGSWFEVGFAARPRELVLHVMAGFAGEDEVLACLGRHRRGVSCLYLRRLDDIDFRALSGLLRRSVKAIRRRHPRR